MIRTLSIVYLLSPAAVIAKNITNGGPSDRIGWYSGPDTRGTLDVVWQCLFTLFLCVWTVLHLNIPHIRHSGMKSIERKFAWMSATAFTPEFITAMALEDYKSARKSVKLMKDLGHTEWKMEHAHYADMGGIRLVADNREPFFPTAQDLYILMSSDKRMELPQITKYEIEDKSKSDNLAKAIACLSATWLTAQVIGRAASHLPVTIIELVTVAFVPCSLLSYILWWRKPQDINVPTTFHTGPIPDHIWDQFGVVRVAQNKHSWLRSFLTEKYGDTLGKRLSRPFYAFTVWADIVQYAKSIYLALCIAGVFFGAMHCIAWEFSFPTERERFLWRMFSVIAAALPGLFYLVGIWCRRLYDCDVPDIIYFPFFVVYFAARLYLWYETFASLKSVPIAVYQDMDWTSYVPHF